MNRSAAQSPLTVRSFLYGESADADALAHSLDERGVTAVSAEALRGLSRAGRQTAGAEVASVAGALLDLDLDNLLLGGWRKHGELTAAARRTAALPGSREVVQLATHCVTSTHQPYVDLLLDDVRVTRIHFDLSVQFLIKGVLGTVGDGCLLDLVAGHCEVTATLAAEGRHLLTRRGEVELPGMVRLGAGVRLVDPPAVASVRAGG
ncbi:hypothetical protein BH24ACT13_BH24ACT13_05620 [soil metagenome]|jgi:hypothetical protein